MKSVPRFAGCSKRISVIASIRAGCPQKPRFFSDWFVILSCSVHSLKQYSNARTTTSSSAYKNLSSSMRLSIRSIVEGETLYSTLTPLAICSTNSPRTAEDLFFSLMHVVSILKRAKKNGLHIDRIVDPSETRPVGDCEGSIAHRPTPYRVQVRSPRATLSE